eukprot:gene6484-biopygen6263
MFDRYGRGWCTCAKPPAPFASTTAVAFRRVAANVPRAERLRVGGGVACLADVGLGRRVNSGLVADAHVVAVLVILRVEAAVHKNVGEVAAAHTFFCHTSRAARLRATGVAVGLAPSSLLCAVCKRRFRLRSVSLRGQHD